MERTLVTRLGKYGCELRFRFTFSSQYHYRTACMLYRWILFKGWIPQLWCTNWNLQLVLITWLCLERHSWYETCNIYAIFEYTIPIEVICGLEVICGHICTVYLQLAESSLTFSPTSLIYCWRHFAKKNVDSKCVRMLTRCRLLFRESDTIATHLLSANVQYEEVLIMEVQLSCNVSLCMLE